MGAGMGFWRGFGRGLVGKCILSGLGSGEKVSGVIRGSLEGAGLWEVGLWKGEGFMRRR